MFLPALFLSIKRIQVSSTCGAEGLGQLRTLVCSGVVVEAACHAQAVATALIIPGV